MTDTKHPADAAFERYSGGVSVFAEPSEVYRRGWDARGEADGQRAKDDAAFDAYARSVVPGYDGLPPGTKEVSVFTERRSWHAALAHERSGR